MLTKVMFQYKDKRPHSNTTKLRKTRPAIRHWHEPQNKIGK